MHELAYNLESFNPAFTAVLLKLQRTIGVSGYVARDVALKHLIQPLAGEYGMHNNEPQGVCFCVGVFCGGSRCVCLTHRCSTLLAHANLT